MSFFTPGGYAGTCNACGGRVQDGGMSGHYCETPGCRNSWGGASHPDDAPRRAGAGESRQAILDAVKRLKEEREARQAQEYHIHVCRGCQGQATYAKRDRLSYGWYCPNWRQHDPAENFHGYLGKDDVERLRVVPAIT